MNDELERIIEQLIDDLVTRFELYHETHTLWEALWLDGNYDLIDKLYLAEIKTPGFGTIIVPREGFSSHDRIHNAVLDWLHSHEINVCNPSLEITKLTRALHPIDITIF
jgi:hypothetical protein